MNPKKLIELGGRNGALQGGILEPVLKLATETGAVLGIANARA